MASTFLHIVGFIAYKGLEGIAAAGFTGPAGTIGSMNITIATSGNALAISGTNAVIINGQLVLGATYIVSSVSMMSGNTNGGGGPATPNDAGKAGNKIAQTADDTAGWLGKDAKVITNSSGDKVFFSTDGTTRIRFGLNNPSPHMSPHGRIEEFINGKWVKSGPIYPTDVPHN